MLRFSMFKPERKNENETKYHVQNVHFIKLTHHTVQVTISVFIWKKNISTAIHVQLFISN